MKDILAIFNKIGHPEFFYSIKCSLTWSEIREVLLLRHIPQDRLYVTVRVFMMKLPVIMSYIIDKELFGTATYLRVIEFQKRGFPHAHCIFFLNRASIQRLKRPQVLHELVCAEVPSSQNQEL